MFEVKKSRLPKTATLYLLLKKRYECKLLAIDEKNEQNWQSVEKRITEKKKSKIFREIIPVFQNVHVLMLSSKLGTNLCFKTNHKGLYQNL
jgi:hypothetical protein